MFVVMTNNKPCHTEEGFNLWVCNSELQILSWYLSIYKMLSAAAVLLMDSFGDSPAFRELRPKL